MRKNEHTRLAYLTLWQIVADEEMSSSPVFKRANLPRYNRIPEAAEYDRPLVAHIARNNLIPGNPTISHATWEYQDVRSAFLVCTTFDGTGPYGTAPNRLAMPGHKINVLQKSLVLMTLMDYSIADDVLDEPASWEFMASKISHDFDGGVADLRGMYEKIKANAARMLDGSYRNPVEAHRAILSPPSTSASTRPMPHGKHQG